MLALKRSSTLLSRGLFQKTVRPATSISAAEYAEQKKQKYTERQDTLGRPVSPHVTTYAFPVVALSSITQRITGVLLSVGMSGVAGGSLCGLDVAATAADMSCFPVKLAVAFPLVYHFVGAARHTLWDRNPGQMLNNKDAEQSSYLVIAGSTAVSLALASI